MMSRNKRILKKAIHDVGLPVELRNTWDECLRRAGMDVNMDVELTSLPIVPPAGDPPGFNRKGACVAKGKMRVGVGSWWDADGHRYTLSIGLEDVRTNLELAREIEAVLVANGATVLTDELETLQALLADEEG
jgi:hypothetical protein